MSLFCFPLPLSQFLPPGLDRLTGSAYLQGPYNCSDETLWLLALPLGCGIFLYSFNGLYVTWLVAFLAQFAGTGIMSILSVSGVFYAFSWYMLILYMLWATKFPSNTRNYFLDVWSEYKCRLWILMVVNRKSKQGFEMASPHMAG